MTINTKKLLVISHSYNSFQKESIEHLSYYVDSAFILVRYNPIANIAKYIHIPALDSFKLNSKIDLTLKPSNVEVLATPVIYAPVDSQYKKLGEKHLKAVEQAIKKNNIEFDLIHSHFTWSAGYVGAKLKEKYDVPFVVTAHGYDIYDLPFKDEEWKEKIEYVLNTADCIITVSNSNLRCIEKLDVDTPVKVIPNGFNDEMFNPVNSEECRKTLNLPIDKKIILTVGNLVEVKGYKYLIEAMSEVVKHRKDVLCLIVGGGELEHKLDKQIKSAGLQDYVKLVGGKSHNDIPIWMNACDLFVLPSVRESFGVVQIEAMACGKPMVATYNGGSEEIITSEKLGILVESANPSMLADRISFSLNHNWDREIITEYVERFAWKNISDDILKVYNNVLSMHHYIANK